MLSLIGNLKIDESKPERVKMLLASIRSFAFMKDHCHFVLNLEGASVELMTKADDTLKDCGFNYKLCNLIGNSYGETYLRLMEMTEHDYILNFMEDHFCVLDDVVVFGDIIGLMRKHGVDELKASFFEVENNSCSAITMFEDGILKIFNHCHNNFRKYCLFYKKRFYVGVNFITSAKFAYRIWNRPLGKRPHAYEIGNWSHEWEHITAIPIAEILAPIDDPHGELGSHLLARNEPKFQRIYDSVI